MYRLAYRRFSDHESLLVNHSVAVNGSGGVRWYEIRSPGSTPVVAQQGTYAPDSNYRWMGSIAMDRIGDIAVGYSISSAAVYPSIAFAGRVPSDPAGVLETETSVITGSGSQTGILSRWGDYSAMSVDPTDDCTFWYTQEYLVSNGSWNWRTRITNFAFPGCSSGGYIGFYPGTLSFGSQAVGTVSASQQITLSNHEPGALAITSVAASGDFLQNNNCGSSLAPNTSCTINVSFQPSTTGVRTGTLSVIDSGPGSPRTATLSGFGTQTATCTPGMLSNAGFESGALDCWTSGGAYPPLIATLQAHSGSFSAQLGANGQPEPDGDSWMYQSVAVPSGMQRPTLTFWYWPWTGDSIQYDWQEAQIRDSNGNMLAQIFKIASNAGTWRQITFDLTPYKGQTVQIYFNSHEDGDGNPTYMYVDDVSISDTSVSGLRFVPVTPCRIADTRGPAGIFGGPSIDGGSSRDFPIPQAGCNIPQTAAAYALNATAIPHGPMWYLTIWPSGNPRPVVSTMNSSDGRVKANAVVVPAGSNQGVSVFVTNTADVVLDINGYFVSASDNSALAFYPLTPCRVVDTRWPTGALGAPHLSDRQARQFPVLAATACNIPNTAQAYSLNFTAIPANGETLGFLSVWPAGQPRPWVSTLNAPTGATTANAAIVPGGSGGDVMVYAAANSADVVVDINGYFALASSAPNPMSLYTMQPCRSLDTRDPRQGHLFQGELTVNVLGGPCSMPASAEGYVLNATVLPRAGLAYLTLWPDGQQQPVVSTLNAWDGSTTSNMAIVPTSNGDIDTFAVDPTDLLLDLFGYFAP